MKKAGRVLILLLLIVSSHPLVSVAQETNIPRRKDGFYIGPSVGLWFPDGRNSVMGHPVLAGLMLELKSGKGAVSLVFDVVINEGTRDTLYIKYHDELLKKNKFAAGQLGLDVDYEILGRKKFSLEAGAGLGVGNISYHNPDQDTNVGRTSLYFSPGLSFRYFTGNHQFLKLKAQYYMANYRLKDNVSTDFRGNYPTVKLIYAW